MQLATTILAFLLFPLPAVAEQGYALMPGMESIPGPHGGTFGVETLPGVRYYQGEIEGSAIEIAPGVQSYNLRPSATDEVIRRSEESSRANERAFSDLERSRNQLHRDHQNFMDRLRNGSSR